MQNMCSEGVTSDETRSFAQHLITMQVESRLVVKGLGVKGETVVGRLGVEGG